MFACLIFLGAQLANAQTGANAPQPATSAPPAPTAHTSQAAVAGTGAALYRSLATADLDPKAVFGIRNASLDREDLHVTFEDGTIAFVHAVDGRITGAFFEGEGEVLLIPPEMAERGSLALFTGAAILEEKFTSAYLRFNDDTAQQLQDALRPTDQADSFLAKWSAASRTLAEADALRLMTSYLNAPPPGVQDRMLRLRIQGTTLGIFDVYFDTLSAEQIAIFKFTYGEQGTGYYDVLASFPMRSARRGPVSGEAERSLVESTGTLNRLRIHGYTINARVTPPHELAADTDVDLEVRESGDRIVFFELSRALKLSAVERDGKPVEFLQNEAIEGSALARRGNDVVAVLFPEALRRGQRFHLKFSYAGTVLSDAGGGLLYVGARGIWYPNRGMAMADFDLTFRYPSGWTLVATGKRTEQKTEGDFVQSRWVSERAIPLAGFNLGRYSSDTVRADGVLIEAYAASGMENAFPGARASALPPPVLPVPRPGTPDIHLPVQPLPPMPARNTEEVARASARAIEFFSRNFGPYPYGSLALTQMPGMASQGWPGLVFLSSYAFLSPEELSRARVGPMNMLLFTGFMLVHEIAHQWWGDLIGWKSYRDQWLVEALANYSAVLALEQSRGQDCKQFLEFYRQHLLSKNSKGEENAQAGPVTLGLRLSSSQFPDGFSTVSYGRGAWLLHMLRTMLRDSSQPPGRKTPQDDPFLRVLRKMRERYDGKEISTREFQALLEEELPDSLRYEGRKSLDWFFDGWVNGTAIPKLELKDVRINRKISPVQATFLLLQREAPNQLVTCVPVYANTPRGLEFLGRIFADGNETRLRLKVPADTQRLVLDPYGTVLTRP